MGRLTKKISKAVQDKYSLGSYLHYDFANVDDTNKLLNKLGKFEDFMEEQGFESLEDLRKYIEKSFKVVKVLSDKNIQINNLQYRWQKLKEFVETSNEVLLYSIEDKPSKLGNKKYNYFERKQLLDKMQELEKEIK